jgi:hypothetical protein
VIELLQRSAHRGVDQPQRGSVKKKFSVGHALQDMPELGHCRSYDELHARTAYRLSSKHYRQAGQNERLAEQLGFE